MFSCSEKQLIRIISTGITYLNWQHSLQQAKLKPLAPIQPKHSEFNDSNSIKLLSYYQLHGLGCPYYSYCDLPDKTVQAFVKDPMFGQVISGKSSADKVEACENVAGEVLRMLELESLGLMPCIPQPPKNWCQDKHFWRDRTDTSNSKSRGGSIATPPFVPLQAVRNKNVNINSGFVKQNSNATSSMVDKTYKSNHGSKPNTDCPAPKPLRKKTIRIAANFANEFKVK